MGGQEVDKHGEFYDPFKIFLNEVAGIGLRICGVGWEENRTDTAAFEPLADFFAEQIRSAKCVVMQFPPNRSSYVTKTDYLNNPKAALRKIDNMVYNWGVFRGLQTLCEKYNKRVFTIDPICNFLYGIGEAMVLTQAGGLSILLDDLLITKIIEKKLSRRHFLELIFVIALTYPTAGTMLGSTFIGSIENKKDEFLRRLVMGTNDFRNVKIAQGLQIIPTLINKEQGDYFVYIGGWTHSRAIDYYLSESKIREAKARLYEPTLGRWFKCAVSEYAFNGDEWKEIEKIPILQS